MDNPEVHKRWGYIRSVAFLVVSITAWIAASVLGVLLVLACVGGSVVLWLRGLGGLFLWGLEEWRRRGIKEDFPTPMPGQEESTKGEQGREWSCWREAWESVAKVRANRTLHGQNSAHFNVGSFLQV